jgi:hypothetical protein
MIAFLITNSQVKGRRAWLKRLFDNFGDLDEETGEISDAIVTNNEDTRKVLATVAATATDFTNKFPDMWVFAKGTTHSRNRLYRRGITSATFLEPQPVPRPRPCLSCAHAHHPNIKMHKPEIVLMYGMDNINLLKKSVEEFFHTENFKMVGAIARQIPQHH